MSTFDNINLSFYSWGRKEEKEEFIFKIVESLFLAFFFSSFSCDAQVFLFLDKEKQEALYGARPVSSIFQNVLKLLISIIFKNGFIDVCKTLHL